MTTSFSASCGTGNSHTRRCGRCQRGLGKPRCWPQLRKRSSSALWLRADTPTWSVRPLMLRMSLRMVGCRRRPLLLSQFLEELGRRTRPCRTNPPGKQRRKASALMLVAVRSPLPSMVIEPGGSLPPLASTALTCSLRLQQHTWVPEPGGSWPPEAASLDSSLRLVHTLFALGALSCWCKRACFQNNLLVPLKSPGLFPARRLFGSSFVLLGLYGESDESALYSTPAIHGWIALLWGLSRGVVVLLRSPFQAFQITSHCPLLWQWLDLSQRWSAWRCPDLRIFAEYKMN
eukprot:849720-Amphidinium_carterae.1